VSIRVRKSFVGLLLGLACVYRRDMRDGILDEPGACSLEKLARICSNLPTAQYKHVSPGALSGYKARLLALIRKTVREVSEQQRKTLLPPDPDLVVHDSWGTGYRLTVELEMRGIDLDALLDDLIARGFLERAVGLA
jgi:hypothetical protein